MHILFLIGALCFAQSCLMGMEKRLVTELLLPTQESACSSSNVERAFRERLTALERQKEAENTLILDEGFTQRDLSCYNKRAKKVVILTQKSRPPTDNELTLIRSYFTCAPEINSMVISQYNRTQ